MIMEVEDLFAPPDEKECSLFDSASAHIRSVADSLSPDDLLYLYGRFKLATEGPCELPKPGLFDFQGRKKWFSWMGVSGLSRETAREEYVEKVKELNCGWDPEAKPKSGTTQSFGLRLSRPSPPDEAETLNEMDCWISIATSSLEGAPMEEWVKKTGRSLDVNETDEEGLSALHWACDRGREDLAEMMIREGAEVNLRAADGQTPLHYAVFCGHSTVVELLLKNGADKGIEDEEGNLAEDLAQDSAVQRALGL